MQKLHQNGKAHGDLTAENIIITPEGKVKLIDPVSYSDFKPEYATFDDRDVNTLLNGYEPSAKRLMELQPDGKWETPTPAQPIYSVSQAIYTAENQLLQVKKGSIRRSSIASDIDGAITYLGYDPKRAKWFIERLPDGPEKDQARKIIEPFLPKKGTFNIKQKSDISFFDRLFKFVFGSEVLAQEETAPIASDTGTFGVSSVDQLMTQDQFKLIEAMTSVKHTLADNQKITSEEVKQALEKNSQVKPEGIKTEDQMILTTGGDGQVEFEAEKGSYFMDSLVVDGVEIIIPSMAVIKDETEVIAVGINKGQGQVKKVEMENKAGGGLGVSKVKVIAFYDKNSNGKMDGDEKAVPWAGVVITLTKTAKDQQISLSAGWNLITLPALPNQPLSASVILEEINNQGGEAVAVSSLENGAWKTYIKRGDKDYSDSADNFIVEPGKAYFVKALKSAKFNFVGQNLAEPIKLKLSSGWNAVGFPKTSRSYLAGDLTVADTVAGWDFGLWNTFVKKDNQEYGDNFRILNNKGYILKAGKEGEFIP